MSNADPVLLDVTGGIARIRFNRPHVLNALDEHSILAFKRAVETVAEQPGIRVVVLSGEGRAFLAGGDVASFHKAGPEAPHLVAALIARSMRALEILTSSRRRSSPASRARQRAAASRWRWRRIC